MVKLERLTFPEGVASIEDSGPKSSAWDRQVVRFDAFTARIFNMSKGEQMPLLKTAWGKLCSDVISIVDRHQSESYVLRKLLFLLAVSLA